MSTSFLLARDCPATAIPSGTAQILPAGTEVHVTQALGGTVTVGTGSGLFLIAAGDVGAIAGYAGPAGAAASVGGGGDGGGDPSGSPVGGGAAPAGEFSEAAVWDALKTCFDPEIPINIVDLGLIYDLSVETTPAGGRALDVAMTLTAQGCGMGPVIAEDARKKIAVLPGVESARVHIVWDPVWNPRMISPEGRRKLGLE